MTKESTFKQQFCKKLKKMGATAVLQYKQDATTVKGFPDTVCLLSESLTIFLEFKKSKNARFQPGQKEWGKKLLERNFFWYCVYPENADEVLEEIKCLM